MAGPSTRPGVKSIAKLYQKSAVNLSDRADHLCEARCIQPCPFAPHLSYRYAMFQPAPRPLSRIAREFVEAFREHNAALIREHSPYED